MCPVCRSFPSQSPTSNASTSCNGIWKVPVKKSYYDAKQMTSITWLVFVAAGKKSCDRQVYLLTVQKTTWQDFDVALVHRHPWSLIAKRTIVTRNLRAVRSVWVLRTNRKPGGKKIAKLSSMTTALGWDRIANCQAAFAVSTSPSHQPATSGSSVLMTWGRFRKFRNWYHLISPNPRPGPFSSTHPQIQVQTKYQTQKSCCCRSALSSASSVSSSSSRGAKGGSGKSWIGHTKVFRVPFFPYIVVSPCVWWQMFRVMLVLNGKKNI